jgi:hypothetical protein
VQEEDRHGATILIVVSWTVPDSRRMLKPGQGWDGAGRLGLPEDDPMASLLAVDLGLRTGLALYGSDARLVWYRSQHYATRNSLRRGVHGLLGANPDVSHLVLEGGGPIADIWVRDAQRRGILVRQIAAEDWRERFFMPKDRQGRERSKLIADVLARRIIEWSGASKPTSLRHDAAEAILIGFWGVLEVGWLEKVPDGILG